MTNEQISYEEFLARVAEIAPNWVETLTDAERETLTARAWEECAWVATLTDQKIKSALESAHS